MIDWVDLGKAAADLAVLERARDITGTDALDPDIYRYKRRINRSMETADANLSIIHVLAATAHVTGISDAKIVGRTRKREVVEARKIVYYVATKKGFTTMMVGRYLDRDHSTVVAGRQSIQDLMDVDESVREKVEEVEALL